MPFQALGDETAEEVQEAAPVCLAAPRVSPRGLWPLDLSRSGAQPSALSAVTVQVSAPLHAGG